LAAGLTVGLAVAQDNDFLKGQARAGSTTIGAVGGVLIGVVIPTGTWKEVYRNP
jgi:hypothetical protein